MKRKELKIGRFRSAPQSVLGSVDPPIWASLFSSTYKTNLLNRGEPSGNLSYRFDYSRSGPPDSATASYSLQATNRKFSEGAHLLLRQVLDAVLMFWALPTSH